MKFSGKIRLNIKSHKKAKFLSLFLSLSFSLSLSLFLGNTNLGKVTTTVKIWSKRKLFEISKFSILGIGQNQKLGYLGSFPFFFLIHFITWTFCLSSLLSFLNLKLQQLWKFEILKIWVFDFALYPTLYCFQIDIWTYWSAGFSVTA